MIKGIAISPDMGMEIKEFGEPLHKTVGAAVGGYIEHTKPQGLPYPYCMIVNEEGLLQGLPDNPIGCELYGTPNHGCKIVGNIVLLKEGYADGEPDIVGLDDEDIDKLMELIAPIKAKLEITDNDESAAKIKVTTYADGDCIEAKVDCSGGIYGLMTGLIALFETISKRSAKITGRSLPEEIKALAEFLQDNAFKY